MRVSREHTIQSKGLKGLACGVLIASLSVALPCLSGCKDSLAIKNIEHDQDAEEVDHESGDSLKTASEDGTPIGEDTGIYEAVSKKTLQDRLKLNVVYASKDASTQLPTSKFTYDASSTNDSEATEGVSNKTQKERKEQDEDQEDDTEQNKSQTPNDSKAKSQNGNSKGNANGKSGQGKSSSKGKGGSGKSSKGGKGGGADEDATVYDTTGEEPEIPDVGSIAATGQTAVIVQMLSGGQDATALKAADSQLLGGDFSKVFSDEGTSSIATAWKKDGTDNSELDVDALVKADPDTVLVTSQEYFTKKQQSQLAKADITITVVPSLRSATRIKVAVNTIAKMLDKSTDGTSTTRAEDYIEYHDKLAADIEGSRGYGAYQKIVYDDDMTQLPKRYTASVFTLVIDKWDTKASFSYGGVLSASAGGVGLSTIGYRTSPVSYYLGVAGVVNNAAAIETNEYYDGMLAPAWQFNTGMLSPSDVTLSSSIQGQIYNSWPNGFTKTTLTKVDSPKNEAQKKGFGTDTFPVVIVADADMKTQFEKSAAAKDGLYHPFGLSDDGTFQGVKAGSIEVLTTIDPDVNINKQVKVNPHGLFSSWIEGSVESCLESAWAANIDYFDNDWSGDVEEEVSDFYKEFYRYDLSNSELKSILNPGED